MEIKNHKKITHLSLKLKKKKILENINVWLRYFLK